MFLRGNGDGTFAIGAKSLEQSGLFDHAVAADLNGDGKLDLAYLISGPTGFQWGDGFSILFGDGDGTFQGPQRYTFSGARAPLAAADFDGDGRVDLAGSNFHTATHSVFMQPSLVDLNPKSLPFGDHLVGTPSSSGTATLTNNLTGPLAISSITLRGADAADFDQTNNCPLAPSTLAAGASCTISVTFFHSTLGAKEASVVINDDAPGYPQQVLNLTGTIVDPAVTLSSTDLDFGDQPVDVTSAAQTVTMTNSGVGDLTITGITAVGDFEATNNCGTTLAQGAQCAINITFNPQEAGIFFGTVTISSNEADSPQIITLKGTGTPPTLTLSTTSLTFGDQLVHTISPPQTVTLTNNGPGPLTVGGTGPTSEFGVTSDCAGTVAASASCTISITFQPVINGTRTGTATIFDNAAGNPHKISLTGTGLGPVTTLSPTSLNFHNQPLGTSSPPQTVTLTNSGGATMALSGVFATGPFEKTTTCTAILSAAASCTITVIFTPTATGAAHGSLSVNSDSPGGTNVELVGNGMDLQLALTPRASDSVTVTAGSAATFSLVLDRKGYVGTAYLACTWNGQQPVGTSCTVSPNPVSLNGADAARVTVRVTTTARSMAVPQFGAYRAPLQPGPWARHAVPLLVALLMLGAVAAVSHRRFKPPAGTSGLQWAPIGTALLFVLLWQACGGGGGSPAPVQPGTPAGTYSLTINATAGGVSRTMILGLQVN